MLGNLDFSVVPAQESNAPRSTGGIEIAPCPLKNNQPVEVFVPDLRGYYSCLTGRLFLALKWGLLLPVGLLIAGKGGPAALAWVGEFCSTVSPNPLL